MIGLYLLALFLPQAVQIATPRGEATVPVTTERGAAAVAAPRLAGPLGLITSRDGSTVRVALRGATFEFDLGSPFVWSGSAAYPLVGAPFVARDTIFLPLHWLTEYLPQLFPGRYRWDAASARFIEIGPPIAATPVTSTAVATASPAPAAPPLPPAPNPLTGLRQRHTVVIDPGHGGIDPGNPGLHLPARLTEKDITLAIGRQLGTELARRGLAVVMTRTTDTLIDLDDRPRFCKADCDLFVSIHVNAMPVGRRQERVNGIETYFLSDAKTEDQKRVAQMENDAIRFESAPEAEGPLAFIIRSLQDNEYLRESARLAELVQGRVAAVHPGEDRGVQQAPFRVLTAARRPAILVETGFATNREDGPFLASAVGQRRIALAIADGIVTYLQEFERKLAAPGAGR